MVGDEGAMAKLTIYGGDFAKGDGWFYPARGFMFPTKSGRPELISLRNLVAADLASEVSIKLLGGGEALIRELERVPASDRTAAQRTFIAYFGDGRLLLASTEVKAAEEICGMRRRKR